MLHAASDYAKDSGLDFDNFKLDLNSFYNFVSRCSEHDSTLLFIHHQNDCVYKIAVKAEKISDADHILRKSLTMSKKDGSPYLWDNKTKEWRKI